MRHNLIVVLLLSVGPLFAKPAYACSCMLPPASEQMALADVVFLGRAIDQHQVGKTLQTTFHVTMFWKGDLGQQVTIITNDNVNTITSCDLYLGSQIDYLVYVTKYKGALTTGFCAVKQAFELAQDMKVLGPGKIPVPSTRPQIKKGP
jgi:hypothetical protein